MNKLEELYAFIDKLKLSGEITPAQEEIYRKVEELLIMEDTTARIAKAVAPELANIRCSVSFIVDYNPGGKVRVRPVFEGTIIEGNATVVSPQVEDEPVPFHEDTFETIGISEEDVVYDGKKIIRSPHTGICVYYSETDFVQEKTAADTFVTAIVKAGLPDVENLKIIKEKGFLVSKDKNPNAHSPLHKVGEYYINTHSSTQEKKGFLERISNALNLGWRIEIVK